MDLIPDAYREALALAQGIAPHPNAIAKLGARIDTEAARWAFLQWELRARAASKFEHAAEMLFDRESLEMASHESLSTYHASLFAASEPVTDLTVGTGADLIALARRGPARGFELDPMRAAYARHNLRLHGLDAEIITGDALEAEWNSTVWADPARRGAGRKFSSIDEFEPSPCLICEKARAGGAMKLSPMLHDEQLQGLGGNVEFLSFGGECREAIVRWPDSETPPVAVHVESGERLVQTQDPVTADAPNAYLYDADPAAIRAHALGNFGLRALGDHPGYLTGERLPPTPWLRRYRRVEVLSANERKLKAFTKGFGSLTLKQRGAGLDLQRLEKLLRGTGEEPITLIFYREGSAIRACAVQPETP